MTAHGPMADMYRTTPIAPVPHVGARHTTYHSAGAMSDGLWIAFAAGLIVLAVVLFIGARGWLDRRRARRRRWRA